MVGKGNAMAVCPALGGVAAGRLARNVARLTFLALRPSQLKVVLTIQRSPAQTCASSAERLGHRDIMRIHAKKALRLTYSVVDDTGVNSASVRS
jgi:hypothetical protein